MDLTTQYLGLELKSPIVPSASPLSRSVEMCREMEDAGAGAVIMYSLFEEAITSEEETMTRFLHHQEIGHGEAQSFLPDHQDFEGALDRYLENLTHLKQALEIPVIAKACFRWRDSPDSGPGHLRNPAPDNGEGPGTQVDRPPRVRPLFPVCLRQMIRRTRGETTAATS